MTFQKQLSPQPENSADLASDAGKPVVKDGETVGGDGKRAAADLSPKMRAALVHPNAGGCAYTWASMGTLAALHRRGLVGRRSGVGAFFSPHTATEWPLTAKGKLVRDYLTKEPHP